MRVTFRGALLAGVMLAAMAARAQMVDPTTGMMVDPTSDPADFAAVASGQPGNAGTEAAANAMQAAQVFAQQASNATDAFAAAGAGDDAASAAPVVATPATPKPTMNPNGGNVPEGVTVTLSDKDPQAIVFYTTDGTKPTVNSARYETPIPVTAKTTMKAMALDLTARPSGIVSKTFKIKS